jgi:hypothetical protein
LIKLLLLLIFVALLAYLINRSTASYRRQRSIYYKNAQLIGVLMDLDTEHFDEVLALYKRTFGPGAARYARTTFKKWRSGTVLPTRQTFDRFYKFLPEEMSFDLKCEVIRKLKENYCPKDVFDLSVTTDNWKQALPPLIRSMEEKARSASLPREVTNRVAWLANGEAMAANAILAESQARETAATLAFLDQEFTNIEHLMENSNGRAIVRHTIELPYGVINLHIKRN